MNFPYVASSCLVIPLAQVSFSVVCREIWCTQGYFKTLGLENLLLVCLHMLCPFANVALVSPGGASMCPQTFFHPLSLGFCVTDHSHRSLHRVHRTIKLLTYVLSFLQSLNRTTKFIVPGHTNDRMRGPSHLSDPAGEKRENLSTFDFCEHLKELHEHFRLCQTAHVDKIEAPISPPFPLQVALMSRVTALPESIGPSALAASPAASTAS